MPSTIMVNQLNSLLNNSAIAIKSHLDFQNIKDLLNVNNLKVNTIDVNSSMTIGGNITMGGSLTIGGNITISGNLNVLGNTVSIKSVNLEVQDKNIELSKIDSPTDAIADGGGITLKGTTDKTINWSNAQKSWISSESFNLALNKTFKINNVDVLTSTQVLGKTLPSGVIVGTNDTQDLTNKTINGFTYPIVDGTNGQVLMTNGTKGLTFITINQNHNNFTNIMGGTIGNYYHSNQPINSTDSPTFANLTINNLTVNESVNLALNKTFKINNVDVLTSTQVLGKTLPSGVIVGTSDTQDLTNKTINGFTYPITDGTSGQVLTTNGTKGLTFATINQNHNNFTNIMGGAIGNYYHSNQPINSTDSPTFANLTVNNLTANESVNLVLNKTFKINNVEVLSSTQVLGKVLPTGVVVGTTDVQNLTNKTINGFTYPVTDGTNGQVLTTNGTKSLTFTTSLSAFVRRAVLPMAIAQTLNLIDFFGEEITAYYIFFDLLKPGTTIIHVPINFGSAPTQLLRLGASNVLNTATSLNIYRDTVAPNNYKVQNNTGRALTVVAYRYV